jgi:hypothetical protein
MTHDSQLPSGALFREKVALWAKTNPEASLTH